MALADWSPGRAPADYTIEAVLVVPLVSPTALKEQLWVLQILHNLTWQQPSGSQEARI